MKRHCRATKPAKRSAEVLRDHAAEVAAARRRSARGRARRARARAGRAPARRRRRSRRAPGPSRRSRAGRARSPRSRPRPAARCCATRSASSPASRGQQQRGAAVALAEVGDLRRRSLDHRASSESGTAQINLNGRWRTRYDPKEIEPKWQKVWADEGTWQVSNEPDERPKTYVLEMLPYPSGEPHIGPPQELLDGRRARALPPPQRDAASCTRWATTPSACRPRTTRSRPGEHPRESTEDVDRGVPAPVPALGHLDRLDARVRHPRAALLPLDAVDLPEAVRARASPTARRPPVKWCPKDQTVLANEQVIDGPCERCGALVEVAPARAVVLQDHRLRRPPARGPRRRSTGPSTSSTMQRNWIGRSEGAEVIFRCEELGIDFPVFTTRPDTLFGATFFVIAPEHPDVRSRAGTTRAGGARLRQPRGHRVGRGARRRAQGEDRRATRPHRHEPGERRADPGVRRRLRADGVRHRRDHGRARARRARLRVRGEVRPRDPAGDRAARRAALHADDGPMVELAAASTA